MIGCEVKKQNKTEKKMKKNTSGFTLVEIMIVVMIIGLLAAIAVPSFIKAREATQTNACIENLRQISGAKDVWAIEEKKTGSDAPGWDNLVGIAQYIKSTPECPAGGTYTIAAVNTNPTCSIDGHSL
jgi:prepilin-type N-terminal cleavage/methylation domain-containing protein